MARVRISPHLFVLLAFATLIAAPLSAPGYFMFAHDARHTVYFMQMFDAGLRDGALFPRWATDMVFGYGYPVWLILAPLPYYGAEFFHLLGLDFPASIKAVEAVGWFASGLSMYLFASRAMDKNAGLVAAIAYLYVPYHVVDIYVRGAMAEFLAFVFPPLILWGILQVFSTRRVFYVPLVALFYGAMLMTHIQMTVLFSPVIVGYIAALWWEERRTADEGRRTTDEEGRGTDDERRTTKDEGRIAMPRTGGNKLGGILHDPAVASFLALVWGVGIAGVFFVPILAEQRYLNNDPLIGGFFNFRLHFVNPSQLVSPFWGYGYAGINGNDQFSLQLGVMPLFLGTVALFTLRRGVKGSAQVAYFALVTIAAVIAMLSISTPLWELAAPVVAFTQFPWRVLFVSAFGLAFLAGAAIRAMPSADSLRAALVLSLLLALALFPYARPQYTEAQFTWNTMMDFQVKDRELLGDTTWVQARPQDSPLVEQYRAGNITRKATVVEGEAQIELLERRALGDTIRVNASTPSRIEFYTRYFPGWTATMDGNPVEIAPFGEQGLIALQVPAGAHTITTRWGTTTPRVIGAIISVISLGAAFLALYRTRKLR